MFKIIIEYSSFKGFCHLKTRWDDLWWMYATPIIYKQKPVEVCRMWFQFGEGRSWAAGCESRVMKVWVFTTLALIKDEIFMTRNQLSSEATSEILSLDQTFNLIYMWFHTQKIPIYLDRGIMLFFITWV